MDNNLNFRVNLRKSQDQLDPQKPSDGENKSPKFREAAKTILNSTNREFILTSVNNIQKKIYREKESESSKENHFFRRHSSVSPEIEQKDSIHQNNLSQFKGPDLTFDEVVKNLYLRKHFKKFLEIEYSEENLNFYLEVEEFHSSEKKSLHRRKLFLKIFSEYIIEGGTQELNLTSGVRKKLLFLFENIKSFDSIVEIDDYIQEDIFSLAKEEIKQLIIRDTFPRYKKTEEFLMIRDLISEPTPSIPSNNLKSKRDSSPLPNKSIVSPTKLRAESSLNEEDSRLSPLKFRQSSPNSKVSVSVSKSPKRNSSPIKTYEVGTSPISIASKTYSQKRDSTPIRNSSEFPSIKVSEQSETQTFESSDEAISSSSPKPKFCPIKILKGSTTDSVLRTKSPDSCDEKDPQPIIITTLMKKTKSSDSVSPNLSHSSRNSSRNPSPTYFRQSDRSPTFSFKQKDSISVPKRPNTLMDEKTLLNEIQLLKREREEQLEREQQREQRLLIEKQLATNVSSKSPERKVLRKPPPLPPLCTNTPPLSPICSPLPSPHSSYSPISPHSLRNSPNSSHSLRNSPNSSLEVIPLITPSISSPSLSPPPQRFQTKV